MIKKSVILISIFLLLGFASVNAALNCPRNSDEFSEFKSISSAALLEFLADPTKSKLNSNEVSDISSFFDKYKDRWTSADCSEVGTASGETIKSIIEKYTGVVDAGLSCRVENPKWSAQQAVQSTVVSLSVDTPKCKDRDTVKFVVKEKDFTKENDNAQVNPNDGIVLDGKATTTWKVEWQEDLEATPSGPRNDNPPEYYFTASVGSSLVTSGLLFASQCKDADRDGYNDISCGGNDCKDNDGSVHPNAAEACDTKDNDCDLEADEGGICGYDHARRTRFDGAGNIVLLKDNCIGDPDLDLLSLFIRSPALTNSSSGWKAEYGRYDFNADGKIDLRDFFVLGGRIEGFDLDKDNYDTTRCHNDCNDKNKNVNPGSAEVCDGGDNNCDKKVDYAFSLGDLDNTCGQSKWVSTGQTKWVTVNYACQQTELREWQYANSFCEEGVGCKSQNTASRWYETGNTRNINDGATCHNTYCSGSSLRYDFKCSGGQCLGKTGSCSSSDFCSGSYRFFGGYCDAAQGRCSYNREYCQYGCASGQCNRDPCAGVSCSANVCGGDGRIGTKGYCSGGKCYYSWQYCAYGCSSGQCNSPPPKDLCAGISCNNYCSGERRIFNGKCDSSSGKCSYSSWEYCSYGCSNGQCNPKPQQACDCTYGSQCLTNWQCTKINGVKYLCYKGGFYRGYDGMCQYGI